MPPDWLRIKQARPDVTDYVIHWTRGVLEEGTYFSAFDVLKRILYCGYLKPTFAPRRSVTAGRPSRNTVHGPRPVVCFSEQPLHAFIKTCTTLVNRCSPYGVAVRKDRLFEYGGRPAIYGDQVLLSSLPEDHQYLWVNFQPIPKSEFGGYPLDWTHEREWRATVKGYHVLDRGTYPSDGVPLLLPPDGERLYLPWILVRSETEVSDLRQWIQELPSYTGENGMLKEYFRQLPYTAILSLDNVESRLAAGYADWARFDTLPYTELSPESAKTLVQIGWNPTS